MSKINLKCSNVDCQTSLTFLKSLSGSMQECTNCGQKLYLPGLSKLEDQNLSLASSTQSVDRPQKLYSAGPVSSLERDDRGQKTRKVKMGSGCLAMLAVMFGITILGVGANLIVGLGEKTMGVFMLLSGIGGIVAFVYFGYWATETEDKFQDRRRH